MEEKRRKRGKGKETKRLGKIKEKERQGRKAWGQDEGKERIAHCAYRGKGNGKLEKENEEKKRCKAGRGIGSKEEG